MFKLLNETTRKLRTEIGDEYPNYAFLMVDLEDCITDRGSQDVSDILNAIADKEELADLCAALEDCITDRVVHDLSGRLYAIADEEGLADLCAALKECMARGDRTFISTCALYNTTSDVYYDF